MSDADIGDKDALGYLNDAAHHLAYAVSNVAYLLGVERIVLCGRFFEYKELFWDEFVKQYAKFSGTDVPKFLFADSTAAPHGAALIAMGTVLRKISI